MSQHQLNPAQASEVKPVENATDATIETSTSTPLYYKALHDGRLNPKQRQTAVQRLATSLGNRQTQRYLANHHLIASSGSGAVIQRQHIELASGRVVGNRAGTGNNIREDVLQVMDRLHTLWSMSTANYGTEYPTVRALAAGSTVSIASIPLTIAAIRQNEQRVIQAAVANNFLQLRLTADVGVGAANIKNDVLSLQSALNPEYLNNSNYNAERTAVQALTTAIVPDATIPQTLAAIARAKAAILAGTFRRDLFSRTREVTPAQQTRINAILTPGARVGSGGTVIMPPAMTGTGVGGAFETAMLSALRTAVSAWSARYVTASAGPQTFPVASTNNIATAAQQQVERHFQPYIRVASRQPTDFYHSGTYSLTSRLGDSTTRVLDDTQRAGWTEYWMTLRGVGQNVLDTYHCIPNRAPGSIDETEFARVRDLFVTGNRTIIDNTIHNWPAEASSGTIFLSPYRQFSNDDEERRVRWDLFTTLIHEMMHVLAHPNFERTATALGGTGQKYLTEGFAEVMRHDLWDGPGQLVTRLGGSEMASVRAQVEGRTFPYNASLVHYHQDYDEYQQARQIDQQVGRDNSKTAFFMGHTELLGIGAGSRSSSSLTGIANYQTSDAANAQIYEVAAGDTLASIQTRTNAAAGGITTEAGGAVTGATSLTPGMRLRIPGIRWTYAIQGDTLGSVASQHNVAVAQLAEANGYPTAVRATMTLTAGTRLLIPIH
jgi:LysM domain